MAITTSTAPASHAATKDFADLVRRYLAVLPASKRADLASRALWFLSATHGIPGCRREDTDVLVERGRWRYLQLPKKILEHLLAEAAVVYEIGCDTGAADQVADAVRLGAGIEVLRQDTVG